MIKIPIAASWRGTQGEVANRGASVCGEPASSWVAHGNLLVTSTEAPWRKGRGTQRAGPLGF